MRLRLLALLLGDHFVVDGLQLFLLFQLVLLFELLLLPLYLVLVLELVLLVLVDGEFALSLR